MHGAFGNWEKLIDSMSETIRNKLFPIGLNLVKTAIIYILHTVNNLQPTGTRTIPHNVIRRDIVGLICSASASYFITLL